MSDKPPPWKRAWLLSFLDRTNITVIGLTACFLLYTRSAGVAYFASGAILCSQTVKVLKIMLRQPRPVNLNRKIAKKTYGMPSTHASAITFYAIYVPLACLYLPIHKSLPNSLVSRIVPCIIIVPWAAVIAVSRIWLGHHTWPQVAVGATYGATVASVWFFLWTHYFSVYATDVEQYVDSLL